MFPKFSDSKIHRFPTVCVVSKKSVNIRAPEVNLRILRATKHENKGSNLDLKSCLLNRISPEVHNRGANVP